VPYQIRSLKKTQSINSRSEKIFSLILNQLKIF